MKLSNIYFKGTESSYLNMTDFLYPLGTIIYSEIDPSESLGGKWVRMYSNNFLYGATASTIGQTGGENTHTLKEAETPIKSHSHTFNHTHTFGVTNTNYTNTRLLAYNYGGTSNAGVGEVRITSTGSYYVPGTNDTTQPDWMGVDSNTSSDVVNLNQSTHYSSTTVSSHENRPPFFTCPAWIKESTGTDILGTAYAVHDASSNTLYFVRSLETYSNGSTTQTVTSLTGQQLTGTVYVIDENTTANTSTSIPWPYDSVKTVEIIDVIKPKDTSYWFSNFSSLKQINSLFNLDTSQTVRMERMFFNCEKLDYLYLPFNTSKVENMYGMFYSCFNLKSLNISSFDTSNVSNMESMFQFCKSLSILDLSSFNTFNVTNMRQMFYMQYYTPLLTTIYVDPTQWNTNKVSSSYAMFQDCNSLIGGNGTVYNSSYTDKTYARVDTASTPGYLTAK